MKTGQPGAVTRRSLIGRGLLGGAGIAAALGRLTTAASAQADADGDAGRYDALGAVGRVDHARNGFDPHRLLTEWDTGTVERRADGRTIRNFEIVAVDKEIEIAPGIRFPAWTYNGRVPGPTMRVTEGELVRVRFANASGHHHSMHFHGIHSARMDGVPGAGVIGPGEEFVYEFEAKPFGCHLYHCHALPLKRHIHKGLYGVFIVDPDPARHGEQAALARARLLGTPENGRWQEFVMVLNGFDTNFDGENEIYAVNSIAFAYFDRTGTPIRIARERPVRLYVVNATEFDPVNSLHVHANFFDFFDHGTTLTPTSRTVDTVMFCQAQRGIIEMSFTDHEPGLYMFHAHQSEFAELGWMSFFEVV